MTIPNLFLSRLSSPSSVFIYVLDYKKVNQFTSNAIN